ncbi:DUF3426 domain-containing protein [Geobacter sp. DSM 9736]|uniref:DUF3426 domain-containing protein n=1 Tax=Geobacter sp. DSM 9736 TaxID=1277350 RepID=UPI000B507EF7|nr:DUF3426 domain-containing protein [Geobacter sp. DSM 9736]SNB46018.1 MJ0042 family finger-like domain-containing protein [Geobacter sp. DSM 9736]
MIVQCGQCSTKFRLDDAKVKDSGVKVRCSRCRHVFIVHREPSSAESEFGRILAGMEPEEVQKCESGEAASEEGLLSRQDRTGVGSDAGREGFFSHTTSVDDNAQLFSSAESLPSSAVDTADYGDMESSTEDDSAPAAGLDAFVDPPDASFNLALDRGGLEGEGTGRAVDTSEAAVPGGIEIPEDAGPQPASSRRTSSALPVAVMAVSVAFVIALAGAGFYLLNAGPAGFDRLGLSAVAKWAGLEPAEEGKITLRTSSGTFVSNKEAGELLVITGDVVNNYRKPRASIQVRALLYGPKGEVVARKTAYCGNVLTKEQLATLPLNKIEAAMNNQFGDSLSNLGVAPGKAIPFVLVFSRVPNEAAEFGVEIAGSTVASQ